MELALKKQEQRYTYKDYLCWPDDERWEIINGVAYNMSPAPLRNHQKLLRKLLLVIGNWLEGKTCEVYTAPFDVRLPEYEDELDNEIDTVVQPDIVVVCDPEKLDEKGVKGSPDWIIEILSTSTAKKDWNEKFNLYEKHKVREYWIIDPDSKTAYIYQLNDKGLFFEKTILEKKGIVECFVLEGLKINIEEIFR
jgi:Uma2 family endonuclease